MSGYSYEESISKYLESLDDSVSQIRGYLEEMHNSKPLGVISADNKSELEHFLDDLESYIATQMQEHRKNPVKYSRLFEVNVWYPNVKEFYKEWKTGYWRI